MNIHEELKSLELQVDAKFSRWDLYRTAMKAWHFKGNQGESVFSVTLPTVSEAFVAALNWVPLPIIPRRPAILFLSSFIPVKHGNNWGLMYDGRDVGIYVSTKKKALVYAERASQLSQQRETQWLEKYHWTLSKTEGVDFRFSQG